MLIRTLPARRLRGADALGELKIQRRPGVSIYALNMDGKRRFYKRRSFF
jgi:hypothetical protein